MMTRHDPPLRVLITNASSMYGGGEYFVLQLAGALLQRGHNIYVSCRPDNLLFAKCRAANIPVFPVGYQLRDRFVTSVRRVARFLQEHGIQVVHSNANYDRTVSAFAARIAGCSHVANVHSFHSIQHNLTHWFRNRFAVDRFVVVGSCVKELLEREDKIEPGKISVVHLGLEPNTMVRNDALRRTVRQSFGYTDAHLVIGNTARLVPFKGHSVLLKAFAGIAARYPSARLLLVGEGELLQDLRTLAGSLGVSPWVTFAGFRDDMQAMYSAFDVYVQSSFEGGGETFPFSVLESISSGLPVVVTNVGEVPVMVQDGRNGFVVPENNPNGLAEKLSVLLADKAVRVRMSEASRQFFLERFTLERMVDAIEEVYRAVVR